MKKFYTYILLLAFSTQVFNVVLIALHFKINQDFFIEICENKDKPTMKCNGKCHLKKQIQEKQKSDKEKAMPQKEIEIFFQNHKTKIPVPLAVRENQSFGLRTLIDQIRTFDIFHPPQLSSLIS